MKNKAIWINETKDNSKKRKLDIDKVDILIIGGGMAGLSTCLNLMESNKKVALIDKDKIGYGITSLSTGKLTIQQGLCYSKLIRLSNYETAYKYYKSQKCALKLIDNTINKYSIDCDYNTNPSILFTDKVTELLFFEEEENFYKKAKIKYKKVENLPNGFPCIYGLMIDNMKTINPYKYLKELKKIIEKKIPIYENVCALSIKKSYCRYKVKTNRGIISAKKVVAATHYPFFIKPGFIPLRSYIEKSYLIAAKQKDAYDFNAINSNEPIVSMRYYDNHLVIAGNSHTTKDSDNYIDSFNKLKKIYNDSFNGEIDYYWTNHDIMTNDHLPYIGEVDTNLFIATGFNKWGLTNGTLAGKIIADLINGKKNEYADLFTLNRKGTFLKTFNAFKNNLSTGKTYIKMKLIQKNFEKVKFSKDFATYYDGKKEYKVYNRCPHMGCKLLFNEVDKTWDCPCHGSRYNIKGDVIFGPSNYSIRIK